MASTMAAEAGDDVAGIAEAGDDVGGIAEVGDDVAGAAAMTTVDDVSKDDAVTAVAFAAGGESESSRAVVGVASPDLTPTFRHVVSPPSRTASSPSWTPASSPSNFSMASWKCALMVRQKGACVRELVHKQRHTNTYRYADTHARVLWLESE